jgi:hypothetical protein
MSRRVLVDHGTVTRVVKRHRGGCLTLHGNGLRDGAHRLPGAAILVLRGIRRIGAIDVQILAVGAEDGEAPGAVLIVSDRDSRDHRLPAADDVPARRVEVHEVAQRGGGNGAMGIVRHRGATAERVLTIHDPVVAADVAALVPSQVFLRGRIDRGEPARRRAVAAVRDLDIGRLEAHRGAERLVQGEDRRIESRAVDHRVERKDRRRGSGVIPLDLLE